MNRASGAVLDVVASMGPPIVIGGGDRVYKWAEVYKGASMGPPIVIGGGALGFRYVTHAVWVLQWGRRS